MRRPYIICHMVSSLDGKVTGEFLSREEAKQAIDAYYELNREYDAFAFACGRITMEESFTHGEYPDLSKYEPTCFYEGPFSMDCCFDDMEPPYAIAFDPKGKLGWKSKYIEDEDPGYGGKRIIEVLTEQVDPRYITYLEEMEIPYIFGGKDGIDIPLVLKKLYDVFGIDSILLEGGSIINGSFLRAGVIDEISLVYAPVKANEEDKPLFDGGSMDGYELASTETLEGEVVHEVYKKIKKSKKKKNAESAEESEEATNEEE